MRTLIFILLASSASADTGFSGYGKECFCTDKNRVRVELGQRICMYVDGRAYLAECQMSQNVPMWRDVGEVCPGASLDITPWTTFTSRVKNAYTPI